MILKPSMHSVHNLGPRGRWFKSSHSDHGCSWPAI